MIKGIIYIDIGIKRKIIDIGNTLFQYKTRYAMKRFFISVFTPLIMIILIVFSGCSEKEISPQKADSSFDCSANISCKDFEFTADISYSENSPLIIEITSPESLSGLKTGFKGDVFKSGIGDKFCQTENHYLPDSSPSQQLYNFIEYLSTTPQVTPYAEENGLLLCKGKIYSNEFDFSVSKESGKIMSYSSDDVKIEFNYDE